MISSELDSCPFRKAARRIHVDTQGVLSLSIVKLLKSMLKLFSETILLNISCQVLQIPLQQCNHRPFSSPYMST